MNVGKTLGFVTGLGLIGGLVAYYVKQQAEENEGVESSHAVNTDKGHAKVTKAVKKMLRQHERGDF